MTSEIEEVLRLLGDVRRTKTQLDHIEDEILIALGGRRRNAFYERTVEWLFATLIEKPVKWVVDKFFDRLDKWRSRRNRKFPAHS